MKITKASGILFGAVYTSMSRSWLGKQGPDQWDFGASQSVLIDRFSSVWAYEQSRSWKIGLSASIVHLVGRGNIL